MLSIKSTMKTMLPAAAVLMLAMVSCQKKFDANSYKPAQTYGGYAASSEIAASDLVAHFSFENTLLDSVSSTSATGTGTTYSGTGVKGSALSIGLNNYAIFDATTALKGLQSMTVAYWINTSYNSAGIQAPVSFVNSTQFWGNFDMYFDGQTSDSAKLITHAFGSAGAKETFLTGWKLGNFWETWIHVAMAYDQTTGTFSFYVNGAPFGSSVQSGFGPLDFANFPSIVIGTMQFETTPSQTTGATSQSWASYVLGSMDELRIYDKALDATEVKSLYQLENLGK